MTDTAKGTGKNADADKGAAGTGKLMVVAIVMLVATVLSAFYAINEYAKGTGALVKSAERNADRFETVFRDLVEARLRAMNLAADVMLQSRVTVEAFARGDRAGLVSRMEPFFETLVQEHGVAQLNFWQPPAKLYYRAGEPKSFGQDLGTFRRSVLAANERRQRISAIETGAGGIIGLRAIVPVIVDDKFIGVVEFGSSFAIPLERASNTSGLKWAVGLAKDVSVRVERPVEPKNDAWKGNDVFYLYSDPDTGETVRTIEFDARAKDYTLASAGSRTVFVKTFPIINFSGVPTIVVANVLDLTDGFAEVFQSVAIKCGILFLIITVAGSVGVLKFGQMKDGLTRALSGQKAELDERAAACDIAVGKLRESDVIKRGFFTNLVTAINEPLQAVLGQLQSVAPAVRATASGEPVPEPAEREALRERFRFALSETSHLSRLTADYQQLEQFRQSLSKAETPSLSLPEVVGRVLNEDIAVYRRLPKLAISATMPADLPATRGNADLLRRAVANLISYAAQRGGQGKITLRGRVDDDGWLEVSVSGSAFGAAGAPNEALLDESRQFLSRLDASPTAAPNGTPLVGVIQARIIIEFHGGSLDPSANSNDPGFVFRLPVAA